MVVALALSLRCLLKNRSRIETHEIMSFENLKWAYEALNGFYVPLRPRPLNVLPPSKVCSAPLNSTALIRWRG